MQKSADKNVTTGSLILGFCMLIMGGCGLAYEYTFSKIASDLLGNSAQQWAIIIGVMLFCMGLGADIQKHFQDQTLIEKLIVSQLYLAVLGGFGPILMLTVFGMFHSHYVLVQYFLISAVGILIGFEIPLLARINEAYSKNIKMNLAGVLKMDYIGALCGALFWIFVLPKFFSIIQMAFALSFISLFGALLCFFYFRKLIKSSNKILVSILSVAVLLGIGSYYSASWTTFAEQALFRDQIIFSKTSKYQHIVLTKTPSGLIECYINGRLQFNEGDERVYHENLVHPALHLAPKRERILVLGGGDGLAVREILKYSDIQEVVLVDLDPVMTELSQTHPLLCKINNNSLSSKRVFIEPNQALIEGGSEILTIPNQNAYPQIENQPVTKVKVLNLDAANYVQQAIGLFDVIIADFPDPNSPELAKLYSQHFYGHIRKKLTPKGIFVQQSTSPYHAKEAFLCIGRTLESAGFCMLPYHDNVPSFGEWGWWIGGKQENLSKESIRKTISKQSGFQVQTHYLTPDLMKSSFIFGKGTLNTNEASINTISSNHVYHYYLKGWEELVF